MIGCFSPSSSSLRHARGARSRGMQVARRLVLGAQREVGVRRGGLAQDTPSTTLSSAGHGCWPTLDMRRPCVRLHSSACE
jgi:hypothetical protein